MNGTDLFALVEGMLAIEKRPLRRLLVIQRGRIRYLKEGRK